MSAQQPAIPNQAERDAERRQWEADRQRKAQDKLRHAATGRRVKDIVWSAAIASAITIIVVTGLGWLTTQAVVEAARQEGATELVALRSGICTAKFQQRPDATAKLAEFKALSYNDRTTAVRKFVADERLATMPSEDAPAAGAIDKCAGTIGSLAS
jgi:hypothetical protein